MMGASMIMISESTGLSTIMAASVAKTATAWLSRLTTPSENRLFTVSRSLVQRLIVSPRGVTS